MLSKNIINGIVAFFDKKDPASLVYLFGSATSDSFNDDSDVDVAFLLKDGEASEEQFLMFYEQLQEITGKSIDLIDLAAANSVLKMEVVGKGMLILKRAEKDQVAFENKVFQEYLTLNDDRKDILNEIIQRGTVYG